MIEPAPTHPESSAVIRRRRVVVAAVVVIGGALLGFSLTRQPGDTSFFWLTLALAAVWTIGAFASGPLHLGSNRHPVITGTVIGLVLGGVFVVGGLVAREIPGVREFVVRVLDFANHGPLALVVFVTVINGIAEELFFRGALYTALGNAYPAVLSTVIYVIATSATTGNPMLGVAALVVGAVCAFERRSTGGVLAPMLTHFFWGLVMVLALPPVFGV
ncbi:MAG: protease family protein [Mycobacterium sp.]|jgi:membrane protease YdiL (CAAX protease family)|nr:protease family protein [Mycobacterium sp.]